MEDDPFIQFAYVIDTEGRKTTRNITQVVDKAKYEKFGISEDFSNRDWFLQPIKTGKTYITDFYKSVMTGALCITVSAPIRNIEEEIVGIFGMDIKFEELLKMVNDTDFEEEVMKK